MFAPYYFFLRIRIGVSYSRNNRMFKKFASSGGTKKRSWAIAANNMMSFLRWIKISK